MPAVSFRSFAFGVLDVFLTHDYVNVLKHFGVIQPTRYGECDGVIGRSGSVVARCVF
jgi:hypothetical protein